MNLDASSMVGYTPSNRHLVVCSRYTTRTRIRPLISIPICVFYSFLVILLPFYLLSVSFVWYRVGIWIPVCNVYYSFKLVGSCTMIIHEIFCNSLNMILESPFLVLPEFCRTASCFILKYVTNSCYWILYPDTFPFPLHYLECSSFFGPWFL